MEKEITRTINFDVSDDSIHKHAVNILMGNNINVFTLTQEKYDYQVYGGKGGELSYRKKDGYWVLIANWCFYGLYMVVRYRKPLWLKPMYQSLFYTMNFRSVIFHDYNIELRGSNGEILRSRRFSLSPPRAFDKVMSEKFGFSPEKIESMKSELDIS